MTTMTRSGVDASWKEGVEVQTTPAVGDAHPQVRRKTERTMAILFIIVFLLSWELPYCRAIPIR
jgi:hypothetical protein